MWSNTEKGGLSLVASTIWLYIFLLILSIVPVIVLYYYYCYCYSFLATTIQYKLNDSEVSVSPCILYRYSKWGGGGGGRTLYSFPRINRTEDGMCGNKV